MRSSAENAQEQSINPKHQFVSDTIELITANQSLNSIDKHLQDAKDWYAAFNKQGGITPGCWLHLRDKIQKHTQQQDPVSPQMIVILEGVKKTYENISKFERTREGNMVDNVNESGNLIDKLTEWCKSTDRMTWSSKCTH